MVVAFLEARLHLVNGMTQQSWPKIKEEKRNEIQWACFMHSSLGRGEVHFVRNCASLHNSPKKW